MAFLTLLIGKFAIRLIAKHRAGQHFAASQFYVTPGSLARRLPTRQSALPSPLSAIEMALKRLEHFERLERLERDSLLVSEAIERLEQLSIEAKRRLFRLPYVG
jgi:hypothetical protein